jgi:hypothetical protein
LTQGNRVINLRRPFEPRKGTVSPPRLARAGLLTLLRNAIVIVAPALVLAALVAEGVPLSALVPVAGFAVCLGMYLFMGHGGAGRTSGDLAP